MQGDYFLDTNIIVYLFDPSAPSKREKARQLVRDGLESGRAVVSWQVVQEFLHVGLHKFKSPLTPGEATDFLDGVLGRLCRVYPSPELWKVALHLAAQTGYHFYDCLILAAALQSGAAWLLSENLQHQHRLGSLTILNPFLLPPHEVPRP